LRSFGHHSHTRPLTLESAETARPVHRIRGIAGRPDSDLIMYRRMPDVKITPVDPAFGLLLSLAPAQRYRRTGDSGLTGAENFHGYRREASVIRLPSYRLPLASEPLDESAKVQRQSIGSLGAHCLIGSRSIGRLAPP
jgi:hypothetical protein